jgi:osmoprotectant transport system substrate-binding protein
MRRYWPITAVAAFAAVLVVAGCGGATSGGTGTPSAQKGTVVVASKNFTEELIVGNMYAQLLEQAGFTVKTKLNLGATPVVQAALQSGQVDLYPEYTGTGLLTVLKEPPLYTAQAVYDAVKKGYKEKFDLVWLEPAPMNDTQALAMTQQDSAKFGITTLSEMAAKAGQLIMVGPPEFAARQDGLPGLQKAYGPFKLKKYVPVTIGLQYQALLGGQANVAVVFSTDGQIAADKLVVLKDDKQFFPIYQIAPVVRQQVLTKYPEIATVLDKLAPHLTNETMQRLNYEVDGNKQDPAAVAKAFLQQIGLLK